MKLNSLSKLGEAIKYAKQTERKFKRESVIKQSNRIGGFRDKQLVIYAQFDKNDQLCDIQPRYIKEVQTLYDKYKGRPYSLICDELRSTFRDLITDKIV